MHSAITSEANAALVRSLECIKAIHVLPKDQLPTWVRRPLRAAPSNNQEEELAAMKST